MQSLLFHLGRRQSPCLYIEFNGKGWSISISNLSLLLEPERAWRSSAVYDLTSQLLFCTVWHTHAHMHALGSFCTRSIEYSPHRLWLTLALALLATQKCGSLVPCVISGQHSRGGGLHPCQAAQLPHWHKGSPDPLHHGGVRRGPHSLPCGRLGKRHSCHQGPCLGCGEGQETASAPGRGEGECHPGRSHCVLLAKSVLSSG